MPVVKADSQECGARVMLMTGRSVGTLLLVCAPENFVPGNSGAGAKAVVL
jgi:hypothetical protein